MKVATVREFRDKATSYFKEEEPVLVTRHGKVTGLVASKRLAESDEDDVEMLALSLKLKVPVWSNDWHFRHSGVGVYSTAKLLKMLKA
jgi:hypothetical protein